MVEEFVSCTSLTFHLFISCYQARGCILVASSPEILTHVKKVNYYDESTINQLIDAIFLPFSILMVVTFNDTIPKKIVSNSLVFLFLQDKGVFIFFIAIATSYE